LHNPTLRDAVLKAVEEGPEPFLYEMPDVVNALAAGVDGAVKVFPVSVSRILARNGYTRKYIEKAFFNRNETERVAWVAAEWKIPFSRCASTLTKLIGFDGRPSGNGPGQCIVPDPSATSRRQRGRGRAFLWRWLTTVFWTG